jgi:hypothetical protein
LEGGLCRAPKGRTLPNGSPPNNNSDFREGPFRALVSSEYRELPGRIGTLGYSFAVTASDPFAPPQLRQLSKYVTRAGSGGVLVCPVEVV